MHIKTNAAVAAIAMVSTATAANAGALEQTNQTIQLLFEKGSYAEVGYASVSPNVKGTDILGDGTGDVGPRYGMVSAGIKSDLTERLSAAVLLDQPFGITVQYGPSSTVFAGTRANVETFAVTGLLRYELDDSWSVHGGVRGQWFDANARLGGLQADVLDGYTATIDRDFGAGFVLGGAYEVPDIALRVALTYNSAIQYNGSISEFLPASAGGPVTIVSPNGFSTPQSVNLDFQTGVAERTLVFGSVRWVEWSDFQLSPATFTGLTTEPLASYPKDIFTFNLGAGHQVTDQLSLVGALGFEDEGNRRGSALGPVNGYFSLTLAAVHETEKHRISLGVSHFWLRDADPQAGNITVGEFRDNRMIAVELKLGYKF